MADRVLPPPLTPPKWGRALTPDENRTALGGDYPPLPDDRLTQIAEKHAERAKNFPGGDSWQITWLAHSLAAERALRVSLEHENAAILAHDSEAVRMLKAAEADLARLAAALRESERLRVSTEAARDIFEIALRSIERDTKYPETAIATASAALAAGLGRSE